MAKINSKNNNLSIHSRKAGILSYSYDNFEDELTPENMNEISNDEFNNIKNNYKKLENGSYINNDEPFLRIVNNSDIYALVKINRTNAERFWINETVFIKNGFKEDSRIFEAKLNNIINYEETSFLVLEFKKFINEWLNIRKKEIVFIKNIYEGLIVPDSAVLPTTNGYKVVIVDSNNNLTLENIEIVFSGDKYLIIEGLELGDEILINPAKSNFEIETRRDDNE
ncbi:MAG: HlyD family efflux transporter periplasmic adaptor subunit [Bacillota bacterium]